MSAARWDGTSHVGSSLGALCRLGTNKGYCLVGCSFAGSNAFFVRKDLVSTMFCEPFTAENHYEPPLSTFSITQRATAEGGVRSSLQKRLDLLY